MEFNLLYDIDICTLFFMEFTEIKDLMIVNSLSVYHNNPVKKTYWNISVSIYNNKTLDYILENYNFTNLVIGMHCDINTFAIRLGKYQSLNIPKTNMNDESIKIILKKFIINNLKNNIIYIFFNIFANKKIEIISAYLLYLTNLYYPQ